MLSHDLARLLLKRRNNDIRFITETFTPGDDERAGTFTALETYDSYRTEVGGDPVKPEDCVKYSTEADEIHVSLGPCYAGSEGEYTLSGEEAALVKAILDDKLADFSSIFSPKLDAITQLRNKIRDAQS